MLLGIASSLVSKGAAVATQLLAIPVAVHFCGLSTYAHYLNLVAASLAPSVLLLRFGPNFIGSVSQAHLYNDTAALTSQFQQSLKLTLINCLLATTLAALCFSILPLETYFAGSSTGNIDTTLVLSVLAAMNIAGGVFSTVEAYQSGLHETHVLYFRSTISNIISATLLFTVIPSYPSIISLIAVLQVVPFLTRFSNCVYFCARRLDIVMSQHGSKAADIMRDAFGYTIVTGLCAYLSFQVPLLALTSNSQYAAASLVAVAMQSVLQLHGLVAVMLVPGIPAVTCAVASGDTEVVHKIWRGAIIAINTAGFATTVAGVMTGVLVALPYEISRHAATAILLGAGVLFWVTAVESFLLTFLLSTTAASCRTFAYKVVAVKSLAIACCAVLLSSLGVEIYALLAMAACVLLLSALPLRKVLQTRIIGCLKST
jgi:hypothetical protein